MKNDFVKRNCIQKYFDFIKERIKIGLKEAFEYKLNTWSAILMNTVYVGVMMIFFLTLSPLLENVLSWKIKDYFLYLIIGLVMSKFLILFSLKQLAKNILLGAFNTVLVKPINPFLFFSTQFGGAVFVTLGIFFFLMIAFILLFYKISLTFIIYFIFSIFYISLFSSFFSSTAFFMKENSMFINIPRKLNNRVREFTPKSFETYSFGSLLYLFPSAATGFILVEFLKGNFEYIPIILKIIFPSFLIMVMGIYLMWKIGLKKYEAFG
jgi:ABC-type uncharacterized transport system permease subunit